MLQASCDISFLSKDPKMSESINCNFARCAVRYCTSVHMKGKLLPKGKIPEIMRDYNTIFTCAEGLQVTYGLAAKRFPTINRLFNNKWHTQQMKGAYLSVFSTEAWSVLPPEERAKHTLKECRACMDKFSTLSNTFPIPEKETNYRSKKINHN